MERRAGYSLTRAPRGIPELAQILDNTETRSSTFPTVKAKKKRPTRERFEGAGPRGQNGASDAYQRPRVRLVPAGVNFFAAKILRPDARGLGQMA